MKQKKKIIWIYFVAADAKSHITTWREMNEHLKDLYDIHFILAYKDNNKCFTENCELIQLKKTFLPDRFVFTFKSFFKFVKLYRRVQPDLVILDDFSFFFDRFKWLVRGKAKYIYDSRTPLFGTESGKEGLKSKFFRRYSKMVLQHNKKYHAGLTCISNELRSIYELEFKMQTNPVYHTWPSGVDLSKFTPMEKTVEKKKTHFIYHGSLTHTRGLKEAIEGIHLYSKCDTNFIFDIYGDGPFGNTLKEMIHTLALSDNVVMHGTVAARDIPVHIGTSDLAIMTYPNSLYWEGNIPLKMLEYIAMDIPVLCVELNVFKKMTHGYNKVVFIENNQPENICKGLIDFKKRQSEMKATKDNTKKIIARYEWRTIANKLHRYIESLNL